MQNLLDVCTEFLAKDSNYQNMLTCMQNTCYQVSCASIFAETNMLNQGVLSTKLLEEINWKENSSQQHTVYKGNKMVQNCSVLYTYIYICSLFPKKILDGNWKANMAKMFAKSLFFSSWNKDKMLNTESVV